MEPLCCMIGWKSDFFFSVLNPRCILPIKINIINNIFYVKRSRILPLTLNRLSNAQSIAMMYSRYGDGFIISPLHEAVSLSLPEGIHGSDEGFSLVLACSQSRSSSLPWLYPHAASGFSKLQSPVTKGRNLYGYTVFPLTCCSNEWIYKLYPTFFFPSLFPSGIHNAICQTMRCI